MKPTFEDGSYQKEESEFFGMNHSYNIMVEVEKSLRDSGIVGAESKLGKIQEIERFIEQNLPRLTREQQVSHDGFISPAHMMARAVKLVEQTISQRNSADTPKAIIASEQAYRLMSYGTRDERVQLTDIRGRVSQKFFDLPNFIEIPADWKRKQDGQSFLIQLEQFIVRRKQKKPIDKSDLSLLGNLSDLINMSYDAITVDKTRAEQSPYAREMILINLAILSAEARKYQGQCLPANETNVDTIQLIRGLYKYNEQAEIEQRRKPGIKFNGLPKVVEQPGKLRT